MRATKICCVCNSAVSLSNFTKHTGSKKCLSGGKQVVNSGKDCKYCGEVFSSSIGRGVHEVQCNQNPKQRSLNKGRLAWNKGMRTKPDLRDPQFIGKRGGYRPRAGRSKKFSVKDSFGNAVVLQSTFELKCSEVLNSLGYKWIRPKALKYDNKNYFADFYLPEFNIYLDPKNSYKAMLDQEKINKVMLQNNVKVFILLEEHLTQEYLARII